MACVPRAPSSRPFSRQTSASTKTSPPPPATAMLVFLIEAFAEPLRQSRQRSFAGHLARGGGIDDVIQQHQTILDAVKARNRKAAAQAMRDHLQQTEEDLRTHLQRTTYEQARAVEA